MDRIDRHLIYYDIANSIINDKMDEKNSKFELIDENNVENIEMHLKEFEINRTKDKGEFIEYIIELALHVLAIQHNTEFNWILNNLINPYEFNKRLEKEKND